MSSEHVRGPSGGDEMADVARMGSGRPGMPDRVHSERTVDASTGVLVDSPVSAAVSADDSSTSTSAGNGQTATTTTGAFLGDFTASQRMPWLRKTGPSGSSSNVVESNLPRRLPSFSGPSTANSTTGVELPSYRNAGGGAHSTYSYSRSQYAGSHVGSMAPSTSSNVVLSFSMDMMNNKPYTMATPMNGSVAGGPARSARVASFRDGSTVLGEDDEDMAAVAPMMKEEGPLGELKSKRHLLLGMGLLVPFLLEAIALSIEWWVFRYRFTQDSETTTYDWSLDLSQDCNTSSGFCQQYDAVRSCVYLALVGIVVASVSSMLAAYRHVKTFGYGAAGALLFAFACALAATSVFTKMVSDQQEYWSSDDSSYGYALNAVVMVTCLVFALPLLIFTRRTEIYFEHEKDLTLKVKGGQLMRLMKKTGRKGMPFHLGRQWVPLADVGGEGGSVVSGGMEGAMQQQPLFNKTSGIDEGSDSDDDTVARPGGMMGEDADFDDIEVA